MKRRLLSLLILCSSFAAFGQITYEKDYASALKQAKTKTPLFIFITPDERISESNYTSGISLPEVVTFYNKNFSSLKLTFTSPAGREMALKYQINRYPYYLFLDTNENLIFTGFSNSLRSEFFSIWPTKCLKEWKIKLPYSNWNNNTQAANEVKASLKTISP